MESFKRVEYGNLIVDLGKGEAILRREELLNREVFRRSDRIRAYINDVRHDLKRSTNFFLSRAHNNFLVKFFFRRYLKFMTELLKLNQLQEIQVVELK